MRAKRWKPTIFFLTLLIILLLFEVGLKLDLHIIRTLGPVASATGLGQVFFTSVIILYSHPLYEKMSPWLGVYEKAESDQGAAIG